MYFTVVKTVMAQYRAVYPLASKGEYVPFDIVDFLIRGDGEVLPPGQIRITGNINIGEIDTYKLDGITGLHGMIDRIATVSVNTGQLESIQNYGRCARTLRMMTRTLDQLSGSAVDAIALCASDPVVTTTTLNGTSGNISTDTSIGYSKIIPFSIKPVFCLNSFSGLLDLDKIGDLQVSIRLAPVTEFLFGNANMTYTVTDLRLEYMLQPRTSAPVASMQVLSSVRQLANSSHFTFASNHPIAAATSVFITFQSLPSVGDPMSNALVCPSVGPTQVLFELSANQTVLRAYPVETPEEQIIQTQIAAKDIMSDRICYSLWSQSVSTDPNDGNDFFSLGLSFGTPVDLRRQAIGVSFDSDVTPVTNHFVYMLVLGQIAV